MASLLVLAPFFCILILSIPSRNIMQRLAFGLGLVVSLLQACLVSFPEFCYQASICNFLSPFFKFNFFIDDLTRVMLLSIGIVTAVSFMVARYFISDKKQLFYFCNMLLVILAGMNGVVLVNDIFSLYVFLEITAVASFILISFERKIDAFEGAFKYMILSAIASILILSAVSLILLVAGDTSFSQINMFYKNSGHSLVVVLGMALFLCGVFIKAGLIPFHGWLPDAYSSAPAATSVLLAGIVTKVVGVYSLIRITVSLFIPSGSISNALLLIGIVSVILGALLALGQNDFKRMLAYSSISQVGYIVLGLAVATPLGLAGAIFHLFNHAIFKSLLFINQAAVESRTGERHIDKLSGIAERMPITGTTSVVAVLSASGIPPLAGFWSKLLIIIALWSAGYHTYAVLAVLASILTLGYLLVLQRKVFFGKIREEFHSIKEAGLGLTAPSVFLAAIIILVGLLFPLIYKLNIFIFPLNIIRGG